TVAAPMPPLAPVTNTARPAKSAITNVIPCFLVTGSDAVSLTVDGLLLDCDGVLVDSHNAAAVAWNLWAKRWAPGFDFHRDVEHGRRITDLVAELISSPSDVTAATADLIRQELNHAADVVAIPGARQLLDELPQGTWAVVTSGGRAIATARMASAGLVPADVLVTAKTSNAGNRSRTPTGSPRSALACLPNVVRYSRTLPPASRQHVPQVSKPSSAS